MTPSRLLLLLVLAAAIVAWLALDAAGIAGLEDLQDRLVGLRALAAERFVAASAAFFATYAVLAALSVPGATLTLTIAGGALFGLWWGTVLVSFASSLGAVAACLIARFLLRGPIERRFPYAVDRINAGIRADGAYYLFGLRLVPVFPFFVVNAVMGLTRLPMATYYWVSQLGMLPATVIYVYAGTQLAAIDDVRDILSPGVVLSLVLLGAFPLLAKRLAGAFLAWHRRRG